MVDNEHANQGSQCSSVLTYRLGGAQDNFACSLSNFFDGVRGSVVSLSGLLVEIEYTEH